MAMSRGAKPGERRGGRVKGVPNKVTLKREKELSEGGIMPVEVMLKTMRALWKKKAHVAACAIAKDAAPYCHPRLTSIEGKLDVTNHEAALKDLE
jgi:hypothetical protein